MPTISNASQSNLTNIIITNLDSGENIPVNTRKAYTYLLNHLSMTNDTDELYKLMDAILTEKEQRELANRILIFSMLQQGRPQREISEILKVGIATVSRGAKAYHQHNVNELLPEISQNLSSS